MIQQLGDFLGTSAGLVFWLALEVALFAAVLFVLLWMAYRLGLFGKSGNRGDR